jgi:hypothetical protein
MSWGKPGLSAIGLGPPINNPLTMSGRLLRRRNITRKNAMSPIKTTALAVLIVALGLIASIRLGNASAFYGWQVSGVSASDVLMVRAYPAASSRILVGYPEGTPLSLTGSCTGGLNLGSINGLPKAQQRQAVRSLWCQVWLDPIANGNFQAGWVFGRYIAPL